MIQVTMAYTLLGAMVATAALVAMSFAGTLQPCHAAQRRRLLSIFIAMAAITGGAFLAGWAQLSPRAAQDAIEQPWRQEYYNLTKNLAASEERAQALAVEKEALARSLSESAKQVAQVTSAKEQQQDRVQQVQAHLATAQNELGEARAKIMKNTVEIEDLKLEITRSKEQIDFKDTMIAERESTVEAALKRTKEAENAYLKTMEELSWYKTRRSLASAEGRILAVDPAWNFVVMNIGDREGVKAGAPLLVTREGQLIAKVQAKSVEPGQTVADIQGASLGKGEKIKPGDTVIFPTAVTVRY